MEKTVENKPSPEQTPAPKKTGSEYKGMLSPLFLDITGAISGAGAGLIAAAASINDKFFGNAEKDELFKDVWEPRKESRAKVSESRAEHKKAGTLTSEVKVQLRADLQKAEETYNKDLTTELKELGLSSPWRKWGTLGSHQRWEVAMRTGAIVAVTVGGFINLASNWRVSTRQDEVKERLSKIENNSRSVQ